MKKIILASVAALFALSALAQDETPAKFKLYGFVRNFGVIDSREVSGGTHDLYYYMPKDKNINADDDDLNAGLNWKFLSLTTRLGLDFSGYKYGDMSVSGKVEGDFYSLNGSTSASTIAQFRLRQAYMALGWDLGDGEKLTVNLGQTWHPMSVDLPFGINLETCAPFGPFNRSPQAMAHWTKGSWTLTGGMLYLSQYLPMDAQVAAKSVNTFKYGFPEIYLGVTYKEGPVVAKFGIDNSLTKPVRTITDAAGVSHKAGGFMEAVTVFGYVQYSKGLFQAKAKTALAQSGEYMNILSGYGISSYDASTYTVEYTPMQDLVTFVSAQYGKKVQVLGMLGYMMQLGTTKDLSASAAVVNKTFDAGGNLWINTAAATNIQQAFRATPTILWNLGKFQVGLEYDFTYAQFGNSAASRAVRGLYYDADTHWVGNHRLLCMTKFNF